jgi:TP901 family phage tail tape measure protein
VASFVLTANIQLQVANLSATVAQIQQQLSKIQANVNINTPRGFNQSTSGLQAQVQAVNNISTAYTSSAKAAGQARTAAFQFGEQIGLSARRFAAFSVAASAIIGLVRSIHDGVAAAAEFQREMVRFEQVGGDAAKTIQGVSQEITRLSTTLGTSSTDLSKVATTLRQAGISADDTKIALEAIARTTLTPTFGNITSTVEGAIAAMQQFDLQAKDLKSVLGSVNAVSAQFAVESEDLVQVIRRSGGAFKAAGGNLNELLALFTSVRSTTRESAETIASGFNTIFARIQRGDTVDKLKAIGVNLRYTADEARAFGKTEGDFVGPFQAVQRLNVALRDVPPASAQYAAIVEELGGFRQVSKVIPLIQQAGKAQIAYQTALEGTNSLVRDSDKGQAALLVQVAKLREEFLALFRSLGEDKTLQFYGKLFLEMAHGALQLISAFKPLVPLLTTIAAVKIGTGLGQLLTGGLTGRGQVGKGIRAGLSSVRRGYAEGGVVPGSGNRDTVQAMLTPGEFVMTKSSAQAIGYDTLANMNKYAKGGKVQKFAAGGSPKPLIRVATSRGDEEKETSPSKGKAPVGLFYLNSRGGPTGRVTTVVERGALGANARKKLPDNVRRVAVDVDILTIKNAKKRGVQAAFRKEIETAIANIGNNFLNDPSKNITFSGPGSDTIYRKSIGANAEGRFFDAALQLVSAQSGGKIASSATQPFDFSPALGKGLTGLFGPRVAGMYGDIKLNNNQSARASIASKAVRQFGVLPGSQSNLTELRKQNLEKTLKYRRKIDRVTVKGVKAEAAERQNLINNRKILENLLRAVKFLLF